MKLSHGYVGLLVGQRSGHTPTYSERKEVELHIRLTMFSSYKYLIINLVFSHLGFWSGNLFPIASFPDLCLLVLYHIPVECRDSRQNH